MKIYSFVCAFLSGVLAAARVAVDVHGVDDVEEVLDDRHLAILSRRPVQ